MKKIQYNGSSKILNGIVTKINLIIDKLVVDVKVNGTSVVVVNEDGEREADIDLSLADQNVKQSPTTSSDNSDYRLLLSKSANDTEETDISRKDTNLKYNPSTGNLQTTKLNGNTVPSGSGNDTLAKTSDIPDLSNYVQKSLTVGLIKNDGTIDQTQYATMSDIPDELADLADDSTHRLVTDTEKTTWNGKAELTDVDKAELNTWNLLRQPYFHGSGTSSGTTRTVNADGSVTFTGTASATYNFNLKRYTQEWKLPQGTYRIKGCPSGGSSTTYYMRVAVYNTSLTNLVDDYGDGAIFTLTEESIMQINACVYNGYAIQGSLTFKPFIVPYENVTWFENNILGAKNLIPYPYSGGSNYVKNNVTISVNENGVISASGTAPSSGFGYGLSTKANPIILDPTKSYIMSGLNGGSSSKVRFLLDLWTASQNPVTDAYTTRLYEANGETTIPSGYKYLQITLYFYTGAASMFPLTVSPMLRLASIADSTFEPYAQTNRQLTIDKAEITDLEDAYTDVYNLLHQPYYDQIENKISYRGVTWEVGSDNVKISGTATGGNSYYVFRSWQDGYCPNKNEVYHLEGCPSGGSTNSYYLVCQFVNSSGTTLSYAYDYGNGVDFVLPDGTASIGIIFYVKANYAISGTKTVNPKLTVANKYASSSVASVEWTNNATKAYEVGDYMVWKNKLFIVRAAISSGGAITVNTNVQATDLGSEVKKSKIWGNENIATIPNSSSSSKVYVTTSAYATEIYVQRMNIRSTSLGINETGYCSVTIPILPSMTNNYFVFMFRGDIDNKLYDGRLLFQKDSNGVYGYVSKVYQDGVLKSANDLEADIVVFEKS